MRATTTELGRRQELVFRLPEDASGAVESTILKELPRDFHVLFEDGREERVDYYDTFDFRLFSAGYALENHQGRLVLREVDGEARIYEGRAPKRLEGLLPWQLPEELKAVLEKPLSLRAIGLVGTARLIRRRGSILDDYQKTIARTELEELFPEQETGAAARFLLVFPLRGYDQEVRALFGEKRGGLHREAPGSIVAEAARWHGRGPEVYRSKPSVDMDPKEPATRGIGNLLHAHFAVMRASEPGIVEDVDTEFLHDYRVALRRMRSLLSEFKKPIGSETQGRLSSLLKTISAPTGTVRDLDVLLLSREDYMRRIPASLREGMESYFRRVEAERATHFAALRDYLTGDDYRAGVEEVGTLIGELKESRSKKSLKEAADRALSKRLRRVQDDLVALQGIDVSDVARHEVRIQCKKLRYLFEAVAPLYPKKSVNRAISQLKRFQDALGRLQDVAVQQDNLLAIVHGDESTHPRVAAAIGALVSSLAGESDASVESLSVLISTYQQQLESTRRRLVPGEENKK